ncbi:MAG: sn-glycerol-1-phosphate dehydrogenase [Ruminococcaceae bacterium]|nr:sn-glycerol-1-phosphate dehydrogenase [Oscillospiraceae bacterium]
MIPRNLLPTNCSCGKTHTASVDEVILGRGAVNRLPEALHRYAASHIFLLADQNTMAVAGNRVKDILTANGFTVSDYVFPHGHVHPDEQAVGSVVMHFNHACDFVLGVGSGVINDLAKIVARTANKPLGIVATAPSMDGYASDTSSVTRDRLKLSLSTRAPSLIIGDTDILKTAPVPMLLAGLGDMLAKYISLAEWRIGEAICGEYYCEAVAELVRRALQCCLSHADGLLQREDAAVEAVFEGLVISGLAMSYAGLSRPASGVEHYISHLIDMRAAVFGTPADRHGTQCAVGTLLAVELYEKLRTFTPDRAVALEAVARFDWEEHTQALRSLLGDAAEPVIAAEAIEHKYDPSRHAIRLERILSQWPSLMAILEEELPRKEELLSLYDRLGMPKTLDELGTDKALFPAMLRATADIRDKYILSRLLWDLGLTDAVLS